MKNPAYEWKLIKLRKQQKDLFLPHIKRNRHNSIEQDKVREKSEKGQNESLFR